MGVRLDVAAVHLNRLGHGPRGDEPLSDAHVVAYGEQQGGHVSRLVDDDNRAPEEGDAQEGVPDPALRLLDLSVENKLSCCRDDRGKVMGRLPHIDAAAHGIGSLHASPFSVEELA